MADRFRAEIAVPAHLQDKPERFAEVIKAEEGIFRPLIEREIDHGDARYSYVERSLRVVSMDVWSGFVDIEFEVNFYAGCRDLNSTDVRAMTLDFKHDGEKLIFDLDMPPRWLPAE